MVFPSNERAPPANSNQLTLERAPASGEGAAIAADESDRLARLEAPKCSPLSDAEMTEADCLAYCYARGFFWEENSIRLYGILDRASCWCCKNKNRKELQAWIPAHKIIQLEEYSLMASCLIWKRFLSWRSRPRTTAAFQRKKGGGMSR